MESLQIILKKIGKYRSCVVQKEFTSKKNNVGLVRFNGSICVFKRFSQQHVKNINRECNILSRYKDFIYMPLLIETDYDNKIVILKYIPGGNLCDILNDIRISLEEKQRIIKILAEWFIAFHVSFRTKEGSIVRGDSNLRNFLFTDRIWGLDFEESRLGNSEEDIGEICSSILTTKPMFTQEKFHLCQQLISQYERSSQTKLQNINKYISTTFDMITKRRDGHLEIIEWYKDEFLDKNIFL